MTEQWDADWLLTELKLIIFQQWHVPKCFLPLKAFYTCSTTIYLYIVVLYDLYMYYILYSFHLEILFFRTTIMKMNEHFYIKDECSCVKRQCLLFKKKKTGGGQCIMISCLNITWLFIFLWNALIMSCLMWILMSS